MTWVFTSVTPALKKIKKLSAALKQKTPPGKIPQRRMSDRYPINKKIWQPGCHGTLRLQTRSFASSPFGGFAFFSSLYKYQLDMMTGQSHEKLVEFFLNQR